MAATVLETWNDYKMKWDPKEYGGITDVRFASSSNELWKPDVLLFNSADDKFDANFPVNFVVKHTGDILFAPPGIIKSSCQIDITWFPFDEQICYLKYGSWTYTGSQLDLHIDDPGVDKKDQMDLKYYLANGEWDLLATPAERIVSEFDGEKYVELYYRMHFRRKTMYYGMNWIIPSVLISLSNVLGFTLPSECGEKITLQITNLLSVTVFLGIVADVTPPTSESVPVIAAFFSVSMLILGCSVMITVLIINLHFRTPRTHKMSAWMRCVFLEWMPWLLLMARPGQRFERPHKGNKSTRTTSSSPSSLVALRLADQNAKAESIVSVVKGTNITSLKQQSSQTPNGYWLKSQLEQSKAAIERVAHCVTSLIPTSSSDLSNPDSTLNEFMPEIYFIRFESTMREIAAFLKILRQRMEEEDEEEEENYDWRFVAMVVDRFCLFFFSGAILFASFFILINTPRVFNTNLHFSQSTK